MNRAWDGLLEARHFRLDTMGRSTGYLGSSFNEGKGQFEKEAIRTALRECSGNKSAAAVKLGISRSVLYSKLQKYGLG